jgi:hypothetical protein
MGRKVQARIEMLCVGVSSDVIDRVLDNPTCRPMALSRLGDPLTYGVMADAMREAGDDEAADQLTAAMETTRTALTNPSQER